MLEKEKSMLRRIVNVIAVCGVIVLGSKTALAGGIAAGAFIPVNSGDAAQLWNWGDYVYNNDTAGPHTAVASAGVQIPSSIVGITVYGGANGGTQGVQCWFIARNSSTGAEVTSTATSSAANGVFTPMTLNLNLPSGSGIEALAVKCQIPPKNANGFAYVTAVTFSGF